MSQAEKKPAGRDLFGAVAVRLGFAKPEDVTLALSEQQRMRERGAPPQRIGVLMQQMALVTPGQIARILAELERSPFALSEDGVRLAARMKALHSRDHNLIVLTGGGNGDGSSAAAAHIAVGLAVMEQGSVLLVDADLRKPTVHLTFNLDPYPGLSELVRRADTLQRIAQPTSVERLRVLPAGGSVADPLALLMSSECASAIEEMREAFRYVILCTPPMRQFADAALIAAQAQGVVVALAAGRRAKDELAEIKLTLDGLSVPLSGVVLTEEEPRRWWRWRQGQGRAERRP
jgi:protein-tyrosine kinase